MNTEAAESPNEDYALEIVELNKIYPAGNVHALCDVTLSLKKGDFFALLGNNGAGKSTTIGIVSGLVRKTSGRVKIMGDDIDLAPDRAKRHIGLVPQEFNFGHFEKVYDIIVTCAGYYGVPRELAKQRTEKYLRKLGIWEKHQDVARNLSGGMKRRLMIVRALVHEPEILILDEPTAGVDVQQRHDTWDFLRELNDAGRTILLTTHYLEEAEALCRNLAIISGGRLVEQGSMRHKLSTVKTQTLVVETAKTLDTVPDLPEGFSGVLTDGILHLEVTGKFSLNHLIDHLEQQGIEIVSLGREHSRLEDLFIERTADERIQSPAG